MNSLVLMLLIAAATCAVAQSSKESRNASGYIIGPSLQPLVIYGEGWTQQFTIINVEYYPPPDPTVGTLRFYTKDGEPWKLPLKGHGAVSEVPVNLQSGGMFTIETEVSQQPQQLGWAWLDLPDSKAWGLYHAFTTFRKQADGRPDLMTAVPFVDDLESEWVIPMDNRDGKYPGIALANNDSSTRRYILDVYDTDGVLKRTISKSVPAKNMMWFSLLGEYPELAGIIGQIKVSTNAIRGGGVFTLQFAGNGAFTALPVVHTYGMN